MTRILFRLWLWIASGVFLLLLAAIGLGGIMGGNVLAFSRETDVYIYDLYHRLALNLTQDLSRNYAPLWSPDRQMIAFYKDEQIAVINRDRRSYHVLGDKNLGALRWLSDNSGLLGVQVNERNALDLYLVDLNGNAQLADINLPEMQYYISQLNVSEYPSPDGERVVYYAECEAWCVFVEQNDISTLIYTLDDKYEPYFWDDIVWSPDGRYIAFTVMYGLEMMVYVVDTFAEQRQVAWLPGAFEPDW